VQRGWGLNRLTPSSRRAQIAGLELSELNALEWEFLSLLDFRLTVSRDEYDACAAALAAMRILPANPPCHPGPRTPRNAANNAEVTARIASARADPHAAAAAARERTQDAAPMAHGMEPLRACGGGRGLHPSGRKDGAEPGPAAPPAGPVQQDDD
jgi:hypothetical protein